MPDEARKQLYLQNVFNEVRLSKLQTELEAQRRQNESLMMQLSAMRGDLDASEKNNRSMRGDLQSTRGDLDMSEKENHSMRSQMSTLKSKLQKAKAERDRAAERALKNAQVTAHDKVVLDRLMRVNTIVQSGAAIIDGPQPRSKTQTQRGGASFGASFGASVNTSGRTGATVAHGSYYRASYHPGASKLMRCTRSIAATGPDTMACQKGKHVLIKYAQKDDGGMVYAVAYDGKKSGRIPWDVLEPAVDSERLAQDFDPQRLYGHSENPADFSTYSSRPGLEGYPYGPAHGSSGAPLTRLGATETISASYASRRPLSNASERSGGGLTRERVNQTVTYHTKSEQNRREQRAESPPPRKSSLRCGLCCGCC